MDVVAVEYAAEPQPADKSQVDIILNLLDQMDDIDPQAAIARFNSAF